MLKEWQIEKQQHMILRDEGSNMKKAFEEGGYLRANCDAHKLNLMVNNSLFKTPEIKSMLDSCRKLIRHFSHSTLAKDRLIDEQESAALPKQKLLQDS
uniref:Uncharacterized protein n=1 Tax=Ditylenchus dipsaci TaxID=166011 RepID=A0A915EIG3_9BILA